MYFISMKKRSTRRKEVTGEVNNSFAYTKRNTQSITYHVSVAYKKKLAWVLLYSTSSKLKKRKEELAAEGCLRTPSNTCLPRLELLLRNTLSLIKRGYAPCAAFSHLWCPKLELLLQNPSAASFSLEEVL